MSAPKSLADDLRRRDASGLQRLFARRPDLLAPAPSDMTVLTTRATTSPSISRCLETLDALEVFALSVASEETLTHSLSEAELTLAIAARIDQDDAELMDRIPGALEVLRDAAFVWGDPSSIRVITAVRDHVRDIPAPPWPIPALVTAKQEARTIDEQAAGAASSFVRHVHELIELWSYQPPAVLRSGGLSVRDFTETARNLHLDQPEAALVIEVTHAAGLVTVLETDGPLWVPTETYDSWFEQSTTSQWEHLVRAWLPLARLSSDADEQGRQLLAVDTDSTAIPVIRQQVLEAMTELAPGVVTNPESVVAVLDYVKPRRASKTRAAAIKTTFAEASLLGVIALGGISSFGRLIQEPQGRARVSPAQKALAAVLPEDVQDVLIQADLTVIAPGPLAETLASPLREMADLESRGHGSVYRVTAASLHRALAHGWTAASIMEFLTGISRTPVPQPLQYLVIDAERTVREKPVALRKFRAPAPPARRSSTVRRESGALIDAVITALLAGKRVPSTDSESVEEVPPSEPVPNMTTSAVIAEVRAALMTHHPVRIGYVEASGGTSAQIVDPMRMGGGSLTAFDHGCEQVRTFAISRITGAVKVGSESQT